MSCACARSTDDKQREGRRRTSRLHVLGKKENVNSRKRGKRRGFGATLRVKLAQMGEEVVQLMRTEDTQRDNSVEGVHSGGDQRLREADQRRVQTGAKCRDELDWIVMSAGRSGRNWRCRGYVGRLRRRSRRRRGSPSRQRRRDARRAVAARREGGNRLVECRRSRAARRRTLRSTRRNWRWVRMLSRRTPARRPGQRRRLRTRCDRSWRASRHWRRRHDACAARRCRQASLLVRGLVGKQGTGHSEASDHFTTRAGGNSDIHSQVHPTPVACIWSDSAAGPSRARHAHPGCARQVSTLGRRGSLCTVRASV